MVAIETGVGGIVACVAGIILAVTYRPAPIGMLLVLVGMHLISDARYWRGIAQRIAVAAAQGSERSTSQRDESAAPSPVDVASIGTGSLPSRRRFWLQVGVGSILFATTIVVYLHEQATSLDTSPASNNMTVAVTALLPLFALAIWIQLALGISRWARGSKLGQLRSDTAYRLISFSAVLEFCATGAIVALWGLVIVRFEWSWLGWLLVLGSLGTTTGLHIEKVFSEYEREADVARH